MITNETLNQLLDSFPKGVNHYLVATREPADIWNVVADIQSCYRHKQPEYAMLYLKTELAKMSELSPYVARVKKDDDLIKLYEKNTISGKKWSGILVSVEQETSLNNLIEHLRQRIFVSFSKGKKGILHFANPTIANYFFGETAENIDTDAWLGPIKHISWYGPVNSPSDKRWCTVENTADKLNDEVVSPWPLTLSQEQALNLQHVDKRLSDYFSDETITPKDREQWLIYRRLFNEALALGFTDKSDYYSFLSICGEYSFVRNHEENTDDNFRATRVNLEEPIADEEETLSEDKTKMLTAHLAEDKTFNMLSTQEKRSHIEMLLQKDKLYVNK